MLELPEGTQGMFLRNPHGGMAIVVAAWLDPMTSLHHEMIHARRSRNLFTREEWRALEIKAARTWVEEVDIVARYRHLMPADVLPVWKSGRCGSPVRRQPCRTAA